MGTLSEMRRTKIVCTIGPAVTGEIFPALVEAGLNVARLNFSHGTHEEHRARYDMIRAAAAKAGRPVAILQDLAGPKIRLGDINPEPVTLVPGETFTLTRRPITGNGQECSVNTPEVVLATPVGATVLLADGALELKVMEKTPDSLVCQVVVGGALSSHKGINLPGVMLPISAITPKDRDDLAFGMELGVDLVALSFVRSPEDVVELKKLIAARGPKSAGHRQDRKTGSRGTHTGNPGGGGRHHGGPGRPGGGNALEGGPPGAEIPHPGGQPAGEAGHHRHPDAGLHGEQPPPHPGGGDGRGQRHPGRHRRGDAFGGDRGGALPGGGG